VLYALAILYLFLGVAIVCDDFFTASLEKICLRLRLSEDVAGATFMAAGSSAPELFTSTMSLVSSNATNELGVATIVGSAVFNILVIIAATTIFAAKQRRTAETRLETGHARLRVLRGGGGHCAFSHGGREGVVVGRRRVRVHVRDVRGVHGSQRKGHACRGRLLRKKNRVGVLSAKTVVQPRDVEAAVANDSFARGNGVFLSRRRESEDEKDKTRSRTPCTPRWRRPSPISSARRTRMGGR
jgi:hypothetical protein